MKSRQIFSALALALFLCATSAFAQDPGQGQSPIDPNAPLQPLPPSTPGRSKIYPNKEPVPAARGVSSPYDPQPYDPSQVTPDQNTLAGAAPFTLGSLQHNRDIFDPTVSVSQLAQTVPLPDGKSIVTGITVANGILNFDRTWSEYHMSAQYTGGETFNFVYGNSASQANTIAPRYQFHDLVFTQQADWARWHLLLRDNFTVSPGAAFSGQGMGGPGLVDEFSALLGSPLNNLAQAFLPSETINTQDALRYRNAVLGQAEYSFTRRSAVTVSGSYGLLHFTVPGFTSSTMVDGQAGYDYLLTPSDSIAVLGSYGKITYSGTSITTTDYVGEVAYGKKITGRLAFQAAAGPQEIQNVGGSLGNFNLLFATVNSSLIYQRRTSGASLSFTRGLTTGSGLLQGATSNTVSASAQHQFTRYWSATARGGYAMDNSLAPASSSTIQFNNWFVGANVARRLGSRAQINFSYGAQDQLNPSSCTPATCGIQGLQQTVGVSLNWHLLAGRY